MTAREKGRQWVSALLLGLLLLATCGAPTWKQDPGVQAAKRACKGLDEQAYYACIQFHAVGTLNPDVCRLAGIWIDDMCLQAVYEAADDPAICDRLYLEGVRPTCRAYYAARLPTPTAPPSPSPSASPTLTAAPSPTQTVIPQPTVLPSGMHTPVTGTPTPTDSPVPPHIIEPLVTAPGPTFGLRFDSWSPDSQWFAYWVGERGEGLPAYLAFVNVHSGRKCQHPEVSAQHLTSGGVIWQEDERAIAVLNQEGEAMGGAVCETFAPVEDYPVPDTSTQVDISPDGRYRAEMRLFKMEGAARYETLTMTDLPTGRTLATGSYRSSSYFLWNGRGWLNNELYLIGKTLDQGILYVSLPEGRIGHLLPGLLGLDASEEEYVVYLCRQANPATSEYHLLLVRYKDDTGKLPALLYHSELDRVEELAFYDVQAVFDGSSFTPDGEWLLLSNPIAEGEPGPSEDYWLRPVDPPGSAATELPSGLDFGGFSSEAQKIAFVGNSSVYLLSFPDGRLLSRWTAPSYDVDRLWWSPDGSHLVAMGFPAHTGQEALFVIRVPPATPACINEGGVVFTVPVGPQGVQYGANNTGPAALAVVSDDTFWIADTVGNRLVHYDSNGVLLGRIALESYGVVGVGDVEVTDSGILVLDIAAPIPRVLRLATDGRQVAAYDLPEGLRVENGLTGLALGDRGEILVEREGGAVLFQLVNAQGMLEPAPLPGYTHEGRLYKAQLAGGQTSHGSITAGNTRIEVTVPSVLAGLRILGFTPAAGFYVVVEEMVSTPTVRVDQTVRLYGPAGELLGMARVPVAEQYTYVQNSLAVGPDGCVYALLTRPDQVQVVCLGFAAELEPMLPTQVP